MLKPFKPLTLEGQTKRLIFHADQLGCAGLRVILKQGTQIYEGIYCDAREYLLWSSQYTLESRKRSSACRPFPCQICELVLERLQDRRVRGFLSRHREQDISIHFILKISHTTLTGSKGYQTGDISSVGGEPVIPSILIDNGSVLMNGDLSIEFTLKAERSISTHLTTLHLIYCEDTERQRREMLPLNPDRCRSSLFDLSNQGLRLRDRAYRFSKSVISECLESHGTCAMNFPGQPFPASRYIYVSNLSMSMVETKNIPASVEKYVALSHCWGRDTKSIEAVSLKTSNYANYIQVIPEKSLPRQFLEAVAFCKRLDVNYLWIDSLCIIQDSQADWLAESKQMGAIFANAYFCLAANVFHGDYGAFNDEDVRNPGILTMSHWKIPYYCHRRSDWSEQDWRDLLIEQPSLREAIFNQEPRSQSRHELKRADFTQMAADETPGWMRHEWSVATYHLVDERYWANHIDNSLLNTRGWVLQERVMARRILHYTHNCVFWECRTHRRSQDFWGGLPRNLNPFSLKSPELARCFLTSLRQSMRGQRPYEPGIKGQTDLITYLYWSKIVTAYSHTRITYDSDRLVAISGIARTMGMMFNDQYLAGLWLSNIHWELLWKRVERLEGPQRPRKICPPTWSWASLLAGVETYLSDDRNVNDEKLASIGEVTIVPQENSYTGDLAFARIELKGSLLKVNLAVHRDFHEYWLEDKFTNVFEGEVVLDDPLHEESSGTDTISVSTVVCVPILKRQRDSRDVHGDDEKIIESLILRRSDGERGEYVRVGRFTNESSISSRWLLENRCSQLEEDDYEAEHRGVYRIAVI